MPDYTSQTAHICFLLITYLNDNFYLISLKLKLYHTLQMPLENWQNPSILGTYKQKEVLK